MEKKSYSKIVEMNMFYSIKDYSELEWDKYR